MSSIEKCHICNVNSFKYKCPGCDYRTCSLECVKTHKTRTNCSGTRNRVAMLQKNQMDNLTLLSDYRFLEEIDHKLVEGSKNPAQRRVKPNEDFVNLPQHLQRLKIEAKQRGTELLYMPRNFSRHRDNSTRFNFKEKKIRWQIKWVFPHADVTYVDQKVDEDCLIVDALRKFMEPLSRLEDDDNEEKIDSELSNKLEYYQSASYNRISVVLQSEMAASPFSELVLSRSFKHNFTNKKIIEFPSLHVIFKDQLSDFVNADPQQLTFKSTDQPCTTSKHEEMTYFGHMSPDNSDSDKEV